MDKEANELHSEMKQLKTEVQRKDEEIFRNGEELNLYKGRCANLQRDIQMSSNTMNKLNLDQGSLGEQLNHFKNRVQELEDQLVEVQTEKNENFYEIKRL